MNLNKFLSSICSRRKADKLIKEGRVLVNGKVILEPYYKVLESDIVIVDGKEVKQEKKVYILLNKPKDYITTASDELGRKTVLDLINIKQRVFSIGRLDRNTTGVLILTNDGELAQKLSHPKYEVEKVYNVTLDKKLQKHDLASIKKGLNLEDGFILVDSIRSRNKEVTLSLHSGKNRIVRRIFEHLGYEVIKLDRTSYAGLKYDIARGSWRNLTEEEVRLLA